MSRRVSVEILGDSVSVERAFQRASLSARGFSRSTRLVEKDFSKTSRGILSGSGIFSHLGRSLAFASGGFLAFASASQAIRSSIDAAEKAQGAFRSLGAQAKASGVDVSVAFSKVGKLEGPALRLGFNKADVEQGLATLIRGTGSTKKALSEMAAAEDVARAKGVSLSQGAQIVNRALISTGNSARSLGIHFPKAATEAEKLRIILAKFAGQARANTNTTDVFNAELFNTEAIIGTALLPTLNKYLKSLGDWLTKMDESGKLQRDVANAAHTVEAAFKAAATAIRGADRVTGSFANTLKDLAAVFVLLKVRMLAIRWGLITTEIAAIGTASKASAVGVGELGAAQAGIAWERVAGGALLASTSIAGVGASAIPSAVKVGLLSRSLLALSRIGRIVVTIAVIEEVTKRGLNLKRIGEDISKPIRGALSSIHAPKALQHFFDPSFNDRGQKIQPPVPPLPKPFVFPKFDPAKAAAVQAAAASARSDKRAGRPVSLQGQFNLDELKLANASIGNNTNLQRSILENEKTITLKLRDQAKTLKDRTKYAQQAVSIEDSIRSIDQSGVSTASKAAKKAAAARKKAEAAAAKAALGGVPLALQLAQAKADALAAGLNTNSLTKGQVAAAKAIRKAEYKAIRSHTLSMQGLIDAWNQIGSVNSQLKSQVANALGKFKQANLSKLTAGLGLDAASLRALKGRLSQLGPTGAVPRHGAGAFGFQIGGSGTVVLHHTTKLDGRVIEKSVTKHQQKRHLRDSSQSRGPFAGGGL